MDLSLVDPTLREPLRRIPALPIGNPVGLRLASALSRLAPGAVVEGVERRVEHAGRIALRVYTPPEPTGAGLVWIHGGGLVVGSAAIDDRPCGETARATGITVVSIDYRLAPRHPFPAAIDDVRAGWRWVLDHAEELGMDRERIAIGRQSAGGGLAAALVQRAHDDGDAVAAQWLFCPMLDDRTAADRSRDAEEHFVWSNRSNLVGWRAYLGDRVGAAELPPYAAAARRADLSGLPPAWIYASAIELFLDEDRDYADRLRAAGVEVDVDLVQGAPRIRGLGARHGPRARAVPAGPHLVGRTPRLTPPGVGAGLVVVRDRMPVPVPGPCIERPYHAGPAATPRGRPIPAADRGDGREATSRRRGTRSA